MKKNHLRIALAVFTVCIIMYACKKNQLTVSPYVYTSGQALFKINYSCPYALNPAVQVKINGVKVSSGITYSTPFPGGGLNTGGSNNSDYLSVNPGVDTVSLSIVKVGTNIDSILLYKTTTTVVADAYQTLHITDTAANIQSVLMADASNVADSGITKFRFINLIPNAPGIDLYFGTVKMASNIAYKQATDTFSVAAGSSAAWSLRLAGATATLGTAYTSASTTANQRVFTVYARGYNGLAVADIRSPKVSFLYNK